MRCRPVTGMSCSSRYHLHQTLPGTALLFIADLSYKLKPMGAMHYAGTAQEHSSHILHGILAGVDYSNKFS